MLLSVLSEVRPLWVYVGLALVAAYTFGNILLSIAFWQKVNRLGGRAACKRPSKVPFGIDILVGDLRALRANHLFEHYRELLLQLNHTMEIRTTGDYAIVTDEPENIRAILSSKFEDWGKGPRFRERWHCFLGDGIFTTDGQQWKSSRRLLNPQFNVDRVSDLDCLERSLSVLIQMISDASEKDEAVDMSDLIMRYTLDLTTDFLFGDNLQTLQDPDKNFAWAFGRIGYYQFMKSMLGGFSTFAVNQKELDHCIAIVNNFLKNLVQKALDKDPEELEKKNAKQYTLLDALAVNTRDPELLRDHLITVLWATRDTSTTALLWAIYELSCRPDVMAKLRKEVISIIGTDRTPTYEDLKRMMYMKTFVNEVLRLYPPVPFNVRHALNDTTLPAGGSPKNNGRIGIPKGTGLVYSIMALHRRVDIYGDDADEFKPERWINFTPKPYTYIPFNGGPRICLGQTFAMAQMQYTIARLVQEFSSVEYRQKGEPQEYVIEVTMKPSLPILCGFKR